MSTITDRDLRPQLAVIAKNPEDRDRDFALDDPVEHKVRLTILSSKDFRTPSLSSGRICPTRRRALDAASDVHEALLLIGFQREQIDVTGTTAAFVGGRDLLKPLGEDGQYDAGVGEESD
jgi:hypothetical protein